MKQEFGLEHITRDEASLVTVGTFDGVHLGHQALIRYLVQRARNNNGRSVAVTFDPHPREVVRDEPVPLLTTVEERAELFEALGLDRFIVVPFTKDFSRLSAAEFVEQVIAARVGVQEYVVGYDHGFGRNREGGLELLKALGVRLGFDVHVIPAQVEAQHVISSTQIREALVDRGDVQLAAQLLGRNYALRGSVEQGDRRGRTIGFPTANLRVSHPRKVVPREGVYAVLVTLPDGHEVRGGMLNIGRRPTFNGTHVRPEVHIFDFDGDLYGRHLRVEFVEWLRDEQKFDSLEALVRQLSQDRERCKHVLSTVT